VDGIMKEEPQRRNSKIKTGADDWITISSLE
jgi:hypothetical protein